MRLTDEQVAAIKRAAAEVFGGDAVVRLYGSRVDDRRRGGDIDLHFEVAAIPDYRRQSQFLDAIDAAVDGRKVDLWFTPRDIEPRGLERVPYRDGLVL